MRLTLEPGGPLRTVWLPDDRKDGAHISDPIRSYRELGPLAEGGMAVLTRAMDPDDNVVVIKRIREPHVCNPTYRALFADEGTAVAALDHPSVVALLDRGEDEQGPFLVFEHVEGTDLGIVLDQNRDVPLQISSVISIAIPLFDGLSAVHGATDDDGAALALIHRDISPGNVLLSCDGEVKLADFGVATSLQQTHQTVVGEMKGKYAYMPPEQTRGDGVDASADLFSAGVVLWECLAGKRLFDAPTDADVVQAVRGQDAPSLRSFNAQVPAALDALIGKLLEKDPGDRPQSARAVRVALEEIALELGLDRGHRRHIQQLARAHPRQEQSAPERRQTQRVLQHAPASSAKGSRGKFMAAAVAVVVGVLAIFAALSPASQSLLAQESASEPARIRQPPVAARTSPASLAPNSRPPVLEPAVVIDSRRTVQGAPPAKRVPAATVSNVSTSSKPKPPLNPRTRQRNKAKAKAKASAASPAAFGRLFLTAKPWAEVAIDGASLGENTPVVGLRLKAGKHRLTLTNPHYHLVKNVQISIEAGADLRTFVDLTK